MHFPLLVFVFLFVKILRICKKKRNFRALQEGELVLSILIETEQPKRDGVYRKETLARQHRAVRRSLQWEK